MCFYKDVPFRGHPLQFRVIIALLKQESHKSWPGKVPGTLFLFFSFIADLQIPLACKSFIQENGQEILAKNLSRNFLLHLINLSDFGLLVGTQVLQAMKQLHNLKDLNGVD